MRPAMSIAAFVTLVALSPPANGQATGAIGARPSCTDCRIQLRRLARFGTADGDGALPSLPYVIAQDSRGRIYVATQTSGETPMVFEADGTFLRRLGRVGDGPGEFRRVTAIEILAGDSLLLIDQAQARMSVLTPDYALARTAPLPSLVYDAAVTTDRTLVVNADVPDAAVRGLPLHFFDLKGDYQGAGGDDTPVVIPRYPYTVIRRLAPAARGGIWSAEHLHAPVVEHWTSDRQLTTTLLVGSGWYRPYDRWWLPSPDRAPAPRIMGIWEDDDGLLWVIGHRADNGWSEGLGARVRVEGQQTYPIDDDQAVYDGVIEVIDPRSGTLMATATFDFTLDVVVAPGRVAGLRMHPGGWPFVDLYAVDLVRMR